MSPRAWTPVRGKEYDECRDEGDSHVAVIADPEYGYAVDDDVPDCAATDGRHQGKHAEAENVHSLA